MYRTSAWISEVYKLEVCVLSCPNCHSCWLIVSSRLDVMALFSFTTIHWLRICRFVAFQFSTKWPHLYQKTVAYSARRRRSLRGMGTDRIINIYGNHRRLLTIYTRVSDVASLAFLLSLRFVHSSQAHRSEGNACWICASRKICVGNIRSWSERYVRSRLSR